MSINTTKEIILFVNFLKYKIAIFLYMWHCKYINVSNIKEKLLRNVRNIILLLMLIMVTDYNITPGWFVFRGFNTFCKGEFF